MSVDVFVSIARPANAAQEAFLQAIEKCLTNNGINPRIVGRTALRAMEPLTHIQELMLECRGVLVVAFERTKVETGLFRRGGPEETRIADVNFSTPWNQVEAGMACVLDLPMLVIMETGLVREGLLDTGFPWYVHKVELRPEELQAPHFLSILADWKKQLDAPVKQKKSEVVPEDWTIGELIRILKVSQIVAIVGTLVALTLGAFYVGQFYAETKSAADAVSAASSRPK